MNIKKIVIYTGLFDSYDNLIEPLFILKDIDYVCFTNNHNLKSNFWNIIKINEKGSGSYLNRKVKFLPHVYLNKYDCSIYIDANVVLLHHPIKLISYLLDNNLILFQHPNKRTFLQEILINYKNKNINKDIYYKILKNHSNYIFFNSKSMKSISANRILIRNHKNEEVIRLMNNCWDDYLTTKISRDQLILPYLIPLYKCNVKILSPKLSHITHYIIKPHTNQSLILKIKYFIKFSTYEFLIRIVVKFKNIVYKPN